VEHFIILDRLSINVSFALTTQLEI